MIYLIRKTRDGNKLDHDWENPAWSAAEAVEIKHFRVESSSHRPQSFARLLYDADGIYGIFLVHDRYVQCARTEFGSEVWKDSCVEFFAQPKSDAGYFNFEFNCGGTLLCCHIIDPKRAPGGFEKFSKVPAEVARPIQIRTSLPRVVEPEIIEPVTWTLQFFIPFAVFEKFLGPLGEMSGQTWRGNFSNAPKKTRIRTGPHGRPWMNSISTCRIASANCVLNK